MTPDASFVPIKPLYCCVVIVMSVLALWFAVIHVGWVLWDLVLVMVCGGDPSSSSFSFSTHVV
jgi:hypothetical protein